MRRTKIICTLGPQTESAEMLVKMVAAGMDVARLNMSHATHDWSRQVYDRIRAASDKAGRPCATMMDTQGPAIRTGDLPLPFHLKLGDVFEFTVKGARSEEEKSVDVKLSEPHQRHSGGRHRSRGQRRHPSQGPPETSSADALRGAHPGGELGSRRHINLPGVKVSMPSITDKDRADISLGMELGVDFIALSFVRERKDVDDLRQILKTGNSDAKIISKIEDQAAVQNLYDLIDASDAITSCLK